MKGQREQTTLRLPRALMDQLREQAQARKQSWNCMVVNLLWQWLRMNQGQ